MLGAATCKFSVVIPFEYCSPSSTRFLKRICLQLRSHNTLESSRACDKAGHVWSDRACEVRAQGCSLHLHKQAPHSYRRTLLQRCRSCSILLL